MSLFNLTLWRPLLSYGTAAIKYPVPDRVKPWASECPRVKNYKWRLNPVWHRMLYSCTHMATVSVKGLINSATSQRICLLFLVSSRERGTMSSEHVDLLKHDWFSDHQKTVYDWWTVSSGRDVQMTEAENVNLLRPIQVVLVHSIIRSSQLTECTRYGRDWNVKHYECHIVNS